MAPGLMEPVSWYRQRILETQPWDTRSWREMTHGRTPWWAISTILWRMWLGRGLPFMKTPPSWLTRPCPNGVETGQQQRVGFSDVNHQKSKEILMMRINVGLQPVTKKTFAGYYPLIQFWKSKTEIQSCLNKHTVHLGLYVKSEIFWIVEKEVENFCYNGMRKPENVPFLWK